MEWDITATIKGILRQIARDVAILAPSHLSESKRDKDREAYSHSYLKDVFAWTLDFSQKFPSSIDVFNIPSDDAPSSDSDHDEEQSDPPPHTTTSSRVASPPVPMLAEKSVDSGAPSALEDAAGT